MRLYTIIGVISLLVLGYVATAKAETLRYNAPSGNYLRLFNAPCSVSEVREGITQVGKNLGASDEVIARVLSGMRLGEASIEGTVYALCWSTQPDGTYGFIYDDGDEGKLPTFIFKPEVL